METAGSIDDDESMTDSETVERTLASPEEMQRDWQDLKSRVGQLEAEQTVLEQENKVLRTLLERVIEHRQKSHGELVLLLTNLVSKLPINDIGVVVAKLVEHNAAVTETCAVLAKGKADAALPQPMLLKALDQTKRQLANGLKPMVEELIRLDSPLDPAMLRSLLADPEQFFSPAVVRANRCFVKGQLPRERVVREFGESALIFFNDMTTDPKLNPRPRPEEIVLSFKPDFEALLQQHAASLPDQGQALLGLYRKVQASKAASEQARAQRDAFHKMSFYLDLLHYYENQSTEAPDVIFAQRLPALFEQLVIPGAQDHLDEKRIAEAETLLGHIVNPDHRLMVINNIGKSGAAGKTLKFVLRLRTEKPGQDPVLQNEVVPEFVRHLIPTPPQNLPPAKVIAAPLRLLPQERQGMVVRAIMSFDRIRKEDAEALGKAVGQELGLPELDALLKAAETLPPELERQIAWESIKELVAKRADPGAVATAIRNRLHVKYDADEMKQSWITLTEADPISLIRVFCQLPYLADGRTDPIARTVMETYVTRLTHEKYAATYSKVVNSLKNMFRANPNSPTLVNFVALVKWVDAEAAHKLSTDVGITAPVA